MGAVEGFPPWLCCARPAGVRPPTRLLRDRPHVLSAPRLSTLGGTGAFSTAALHAGVQTPGTLQAHSEVSVIFCKPSFLKNSSGFSGALEGLETEALGSRTHRKGCRPLEGRSGPATGLSLQTASHCCPGATSVSASAARDGLAGPLTCLTVQAEPRPESTQPRAPGQPPPELLAPLRLPLPPSAARTCPALWTCTCAHLSCPTPSSQPRDTAAADSPSEIFVHLVCSPLTFRSRQLLPHGTCT